MYQLQPLNVTACKQYDTICICSFAVCTAVYAHKLARKICLQCSNRGGFSMEAWLSFSETWSTFVLYDLPWRADEGDLRDEFLGQWEALRLGALHFLLFDRGQHTAEHIEAAATHLRAYAAMAQKVRAPTLHSE